MGENNEGAMSHSTGGRWVWEAQMRNVSRLLAGRPSRRSGGGG